MIKPLLINTYDIQGGAARAAYRLHAGLGRIGLESRMLVLQRSSSDPFVEAVSASTKLSIRLTRRLRREYISRSFEPYRRSRPDGYEAFQDDRTQYGATWQTQLPDCDVINLHWVAGFVDYRAFFSTLPANMPVVWTLHDMLPFTGGCHYDDNCGRFTAQCGTCPQLGSNKRLDLSHDIWQRKNSVFGPLQPEQLHIVTPSTWLAAQVKQSTLLGHIPVTVIPYGLDTETFAPLDRSCARSILNIPQDAQVILFVADSVTNRRKGMPLLLQALKGMHETKSLFLLSVGGSEPEIDGQVPSLHVSKLNNDRLLAMVYSAADLFVIPSLQDNLPNTVLEAMACGIPVVGFATGGITDMVRPGITGLLVPTGNVALLRSAITQLLRDPGTRATMGHNARRIAVEEYALEVQARRYGELYTSVSRLASW